MIDSYLTQLENDKSDLVDNLTTMGISDLTGDETFTELVPEVLNIPTGSDLSDYFSTTISGGALTTIPYFARMVRDIPSTTIVSGTSLRYAFRYYQGTTINGLGSIDTSSVRNMRHMFGYADSLQEVPLFDTSSVTDMQEMFYSCYSLVTIPIFDTTNVTTFSSMFSGCANLSNDSLNNIMKMCINAVSYTGTKTLVALGLSSNYYPASTIQGLSNYQDFINAGWTIGY